MKKFLKKRWHSIPMGIIVAVALVFVLAGSVFAAYTFWSADVEVTVSEAITVTLPPSSPPTDGSWDKGLTTWTVSMYPGETKTTYLYFMNASSVDITVDPVVTVVSAPSGWSGHFTCDFMSDTYVVPAGGGCSANLQAVADFSIPPGDYTCTVKIKR